MSTLIKNGTLITASETFEADILIEGEKISLIGKNLQHPNADVIDAAGKLACARSTSSMTWAATWDGAPIVSGS